jgi:hypothetical protein
MMSRGRLRLDGAGVVAAAGVDLKQNYDRLVT